MAKNYFELLEDFFTYIPEVSSSELDSDWVDFIDKIKRTAVARKQTLNKDQGFYRARILDEKKIEVHNHMLKGNYLPKEKLGAPPRKESQAGRINSKGVPCLYLADEVNTAIAEIKPHLGAHINVAKFELIRNIEVVDTTKNIITIEDYYKKTVDSKVTEKDEEELLWWGIGLFFSIPINPYHESTDYIGTQYLSDIFKSLGFKGIIYGSAMKKNQKNLALFYPELAKPVGDRPEYLRIDDIHYQTNKDSLNNFVTQIKGSNP